jgi:hypothetical protein
MCQLTPKDIIEGRKGLLCMKFGLPQLQLYHRLWQGKVVIIVRATIEAIGCCTLLLRLAHFHLGGLTYLLKKTQGSYERQLSHPVPLQTCFFAFFETKAKSTLSGEASSSMTALQT